MLKEIAAFFAELTGGGRSGADAFGEGDFRLAAAALLVHVATLDGILNAVEREKLQGLLRLRFQLDEARTAELIDAAVQADREAVDFYQFTSAIMRSVDEDGRRRLVAMMWEMAYSDGAVSEFEDNVIWRVADLLGLAGRERVEIRRQVAGRLGRNR